MGSPQRAHSIAKTLGVGKDHLLHDAIYNAYEKCGNCPHRITCYLGLLPRNSIWRSYQQMWDCSITTLPRSPNTVARLAGRQIRYCAECDKLDICMSHILHKMPAAIIRSTSADVGEHMQRVQRCAGCDKLDRCLQAQLKSLRRSRLDQMIIPIGQMWHKCKNRASFGRGW